MSIGLESNEGPSLQAPSLNSASEAVELPIPQELREWAVVVVGRAPGVFFGATTIMDNVSNIPGAIIVKFAHEAEARQVFRDALDAGQVERVTLEHVRTPILVTPEEPLLLHADVPGILKWRVVYVGRQPGIFPESVQISSNILKIPGSRAEKFTSYEDARTAFLRAVAAGQAIRVTWRITRETLS